MSSSANLKEVIKSYVDGTIRDGKGYVIPERFYEAFKGKITTPAELNQAIRLLSILTAVQSKTSSLADFNKIEAKYKEMFKPNTNNGGGNGGNGGGGNKNKTSGSWYWNKTDDKGNLINTRHGYDSFFLSDPDFQVNLFNAGTSKYGTVGFSIRKARHARQWGSKMAGAQSWAATSRDLYWKANYRSLRNVPQNSAFVTRTNGLNKG